jgi:hypothetical protein
MATVQRVRLHGHFNLEGYTVLWDKSCGVILLSFFICCCFKENNGLLYKFSRFLNKLCFDIFGIKSKSVMENAEATNKKYGGTRNYKGTRVIFTNGSLDPWHKLSVKRAPPKCFAISING